MKVAKKLLSVLLSITMIITSMSVCFGTFSFAAEGDDADYTQQLADKLKDSAYADTIALLAGGSDTGSGTARKVNITFTYYKNFKQAAELLRLADSAMKETEGYIKSQSNTGGDKSACGGATTAEVCDELLTNIGIKGCTPTDNIKKFLELVYTDDGAVTHDEATSTKNNVSDWSNTVTFTTTDYKGYLAQIGTAANVEASIELGVQYKVSMLGNAAACYSVAGDCGTSTAYYHNFIHPSAAINAPSTSSTNTEVKAKVNEHINYLNSLINLTYGEILAMVDEEGTLDKKLNEYSSRDESGNAVGEKEKMIDYVGGTSTYDALFADYQEGINNFLASAQSAKDFQSYMPTVDNWNAFVAANPNYGVYQYDNFGPAGSDTQVKLLEDFTTFKEAYRDYLLGGGSIYTYLVDNNYIDETYYTNFYDNVVAYELQASKDKADALYNTYKDNYADLETEAQTIVYSELCGCIDAIGDYSTQVVNSIYTSGYAYLVDLREALKCEINEAVLYFAKNADKSFIAVSTDSIVKEIETAKTHQGDLTTLYNEVSGNVGEARANELLSAIRTSAADMIEGLYKTLADRFTAQVNEADKVYNDIGKPTKLNMVTYLQLSVPILALEDGWDKNYHPENYDDDNENDYSRGGHGLIGIQDVLDEAGKGDLISSATRTKWSNFINAIYETWVLYATTYGFADYKQTQIKYDDRQTYDNDVVKTGTDPVTEEELNNLITALDTIITSDTVGSLLGGLLNPDAEAGADFDLGAMLTDLIKGMLFTDDFINTVVQMLYPLVLNEFAKVWADLPHSVTVNIGIEANVNVRYVKSLNNILDEGNFEIYPNLLAGKLTELGYATKYADNIRMLNAAGDRDNSWESPEIVDYDTGKLKLSWGIDEQKEKLDAGEITQAQFDAFFYQAFEDATSGLLPLLTTLITNKPWSPDQCKAIATGTAAVITVDVDLALGSTPNRGYANMLVPIYELLGVPYTPASTIESAEHNTDIAYVLEQILAPIFAFLDKLGDKPVDTILSILPNLVYALTFRMAKPTLNMLQTQITYDATAVGVSAKKGTADVAIGDMLITDAEDALLPNSMFTNGINSILSYFGLNIPAIDQNTLATLGSLEKIDTGRAAYIYSGLEGTGKAYSIKADKADVAYYILSYVLNLVKDEEALTSLLGMFMTQKDEDGNAILDADGNTIPDEEAMAGIKGIIYDTLNFDEMNVGDAIAAIVELANQVEYEVPGYQWFAPENPDMTPAIEHYLNPNNDWTKEKAEYLYDNLESLLGSILSMAGLDLDKETEEVDGSIEAVLGDAINGLFTNETVTALAKMLGGLDLNALLAGDADAEEDADTPETLAEGEDATEEAAAAIDLNKIIKDELGIDLSVFAQYKDIADDYDWGVTDAETFVTALTDLLAPLQPVLDFILAGKDLTLLDSAITLQGYKGYDNAIIPLLEALGATPAAYEDGDDTLKLTLNAIVGVINKITTNDPENAKDGIIYTIIDMLPGILYYLSSNALSQGIEKLLYPVYEVLDTIRPIYDLDLNELLAGIEIGGEPLDLDIDNIGVGFVLDLLYKLVGIDLSGLNIIIYDVCKVIATEYDSASALESTWKKGVYSERFDQADMLTVVLSFLLEWITNEDNAKALDEVLGTDGLVEAISAVFADVKIEYATPNWLYWFEDDKDAFDEYMATGGNLPNTLAALTYPNDWSEESAKYIADNLSYLVDEVVALVTNDGDATVSALLNDLIDDYITAGTINDLIDLIADVLGDIDANLIDLADVLLGVDILGLKDYECTKEISSISDFAAELAYILDTYAGGLIEWIFFGADYGFASDSEGADTIVINGGKGYEKALALILEAIGCENLPAAKDATVYNVLGALATRVKEILADPVNEIIDLVPNLTYFLNANGLGVSINNLLAPVNALLGKLEGLGISISLSDLIKFTVEDENGNEDEYTLDLTKLSLANVVELIELLTKLDLAAVEDVLVNFCAGKITAGKFIYKLDAPREDVITVLLTVALMFVENEDNAKALDELLGTEIVSALKTVFESAPVTYGTPNWDYCWSDDEDAIDYDNATVDVMKMAITYPNDWTEEKSAYLAENLPALVDTVVSLIEINGEKYDSLADLIDANVNIYTPEILKSIQTLLADLIGGLDEDLKDLVDVALGAADELLGADINGLTSYDVSGVNDKETFVNALTGMLMEVEGLVDWLLLGEDYEFFIADADGKGEGLEGETIITINGGHGYAEGLALLLEALGCKNLPTVYDKKTIDTEATVKAVLTSVVNRIEEVLDNPVGEVIDLLPNLIYFLNTNGVAVVIDNLIGAINALLIKLEAFGIELDINELVNLKNLMGLEDTDATISLDNLAMKDILQAVSLMVDFDITVLEDVLVGFALGEVKAYESVSRTDVTFKMEYKDEFDKHDMLTVLVTAVLLVAVDDEENAAKLDEMLGTDIISAIKDVFEEGTVTYTAPVWDYPLADNGTVDTMKYAITYPNNWSEATATYVTDALPEIGDMIAGMINSNYTSLSALLNGEVNVFTTENLQAIVDLIADLLKDIDDGLLEAAGVLLDVDIVGLKSYKAPEGITTVDAFAAELANVLNKHAKGVIEWLLLGEDYRFFVKDVKDGLPVDFITINGAEGYAEGLALLLEALGCEDLPDAYDEDLTTEDIVSGVLASLANRIEAIFNNPVEEVINLVPNLLYFLNTNGVAAVIDNLIAAITTLLGKLEVFGIKLDINELVNLKKLMGLEDTDATISLDNLAMKDILQAVSLMTGLDITLIENVLVGFALGQVNEYDSVSTQAGTPKKMSYKDEFDKHDMVTVLAELVILTLADEANKEFVIDLLGEDVYQVILNLLNMSEAEIQEFSWQFTDKADTGYVFSPIETSELYKGYLYGPFYTEEMAQYIADNFDEFVNNIIYLLGLNINGKNVNTLTELINGLLDGSLYNSSNVIAIRDALAGVLAGITGLEVNGANVGKHIVAVLETAGIADLDAVAEVEVPEFSEDRDQFVASLCDVLEPLYGMLKWLLADGDFTFLVDLEKNDAITLKGAEGYAYGIIPILETLECKNILAPADYYEAVDADGDVLLTSILNPLLDRVDEIIENPASEVLSMLPNLIYFINSNGVDTVVKNTLNAVYALLGAIEPIAKIDLYELIGIDLAEINFEWLATKLIDVIADSTGYRFDNLYIDSIAELTVGTLESYTSLNGKTAYKMVYDSNASQAEVVTVVLRLLVTFIMHENNVEILVGLLRDNLGMSPDAEKYLRGILKGFASYTTDTQLGMDQALVTIYYIYYGADVGADGAASGLKNINAEWQEILNKLGKSDDPNEKTVGNMIAGILNEYGDDVFTEEGLAPNGSISFFQKILDWFNKIIQWFKNLFQ